MITARVDRSKRNIVITGGAGFIGSNFGASLLQKLSAAIACWNYVVNQNIFEQSTEE